MKEFSTYPLRKLFHQVTCHDSHSVQLFTPNLYAMLEYLTVAPGRPPSQSYISEFGHLVRISAIYSSAMAYLGERNELARRRLMNYGVPGSSSAISGNTRAFRSLKEALLVSVFIACYELPKIYANDPFPCRAGRQPSLGDFSLQNLT